MKIHHRDAETQRKKLNGGASERFGLSVPLCLRGELNLSDGAHAQRGGYRSIVPRRGALRAPEHRSLATHESGSYLPMNAGARTAPLQQITVLSDGPHAQRRRRGFAR